MSAERLHEGLAHAEETRRLGQVRGVKPTAAVCAHLSVVSHSGMTVRGRQDAASSVSSSKG